MKLKQLIELLNVFDPDLDIEIYNTATDTMNNFVGAHKTDSEYKEDKQVLLIQVK